MGGGRTLSTHSGDRKKGCGVRDKFTKSWKDREELTVFQLYTTYSKPGLVSIFSYDDQRSFHNWAFEVEIVFAHYFCVTSICFNQ